MERKKQEKKEKRAKRKKRKLEKKIRRYNLYRLSESERLQQYSTQFIHSPNDRRIDINGQQILDEWGSNSPGSKSCDLTEFSAFVLGKEITCSLLRSPTTDRRTTEGIYEEKWFRRNRLTLYSRKERSEKNMLHRFALQLGNPDEVVVGYGDWNDTAFRRRRGKTSAVKGASIRKLLRKFEFKVVSVDEFMTNKCCSACVSRYDEGICSNHDWVTVTDPNWKKKLQQEEKAKRYIVRPQCPKDILFFQITH
ncbi:hypothetical protein GEMRC1_012190 [Eukaryota sp. GEM-RC1]